MAIAAASVAHSSLTGEKLEMLRGFKPFIDDQTVDILHPDLAFAGGFTGVRKIADYAYENKMPLALHNVGSLVLTFANAHFGAAIHNFYRSESQLGETGYIEPMAASNPPEVRNSYLKVPTGRGWGLKSILTSSRRTSLPGKSTGASHRLNIDMGSPCKHTGYMSKMIQIRHVPDTVHRTLKARAAMAGMSLSDFLLAEIRRLAERPTMEELRERLHRREPVKLKVSAAQAVREERDAR